MYWTNTSKTTQHDPRYSSHADLAGASPRQSCRTVFAVLELAVFVDYQFSACSECLVCRKSNSGEQRKTEILFFRNVHDYSML